MFLTILVPGIVTNVTYDVADNGDIMFRWEPPIERGGPELRYKFESGRLEKLLTTPKYILNCEYNQGVVNFKVLWYLL